MSKSLGFWWLCMRDGARGSSPFANDWQWAIGNPTVAALTPAIVVGLAAWLGNEYLAAEHPILGPLVIAFAAYTVTWLFAFGVRTLKAAPQNYFQQKDRADAAERRLIPNISVFLDQGSAGVRVVETIVQATGARGADSKWVQLMVRPATDAPLIDCEVRLLAVERLNEDGSSETILDEPVFCIWSNTPAELNRRMTIPAGVAQPANIFSTHDVQSPQLIPETLPHIKPRLLREMRTPGRYRLQISVSANDTLPVVRLLILNWDGSFQRLSISVA